MLFEHWRGRSPLHCVLDLLPECPVNRIIETMVCINVLNSVPVSQEILSLGNIVAATIFPKEILSLPGNSVAHIQHAYFVSNCDMIELEFTHATDAFRLF